MKKLLFTLLMFPVLSFAQDEWEYFGETMENNKYYVRDIEKGKYSSTLTFWVKIKHPDKTIKSKKGIIKKSGNYTMAKWLADCKEKTLETKMMVIYNNSGKVIESSTGPFFEEPVIPDSVGETVLEGVCFKYSYLLD